MPDNSRMTLWDVQFGRGKVNVIAEDASDGRGPVVQSPRKKAAADGLPRDGEIGLAWLQKYLGAYDLSLVDSIRIERGKSKKAVGVYGKCFFPTKDLPLYRITCMIPGPFPCKIVIRKPPLYRNEDGSYPPMPRGCQRGLQCIDKRTGRQWYRMLSQTQLNDLDEAIVWIMAHEAFHYLRKTRQIPGRNNEIQADAYGDDLLVQFQQQRASFIPPAVVGNASGVEQRPASSVRPKPKLARPPLKKTTKTTKTAPATKPTARPVRQAAQSNTSKNTVSNAVQTRVTKPAKPIKSAATGVSTTAKPSSSLLNVVRSWIGLWTKPPAGMSAGNHGKSNVRVKRK